jgi:hypothetical protein
VIPIARVEEFGEKPSVGVLEVEPLEPKELDPRLAVSRSAIGALAKNTRRV